MPSPTTSPMSPAAATGARPSTAGRRESGQATAEYALVMVAAAAIAGLLIAWAASTDGVDRLLDGVMDSVLSDVS
ncbi:MAG: DUF4244 domain-containing protein [Actinomycetota bacterium]